MRPDLTLILQRALARCCPWATRWAMASAAVLTVAVAVTACGGGAQPETQSVPQRISFSAPTDRALDAAPPVLAASATSGLAVVIASSTPQVCQLSGNALQLLNAGTCTLSASQPGDAVYAPAAPVLASFNITRAAQTITFISPGNQTVGTVPGVLTATATSGLVVAFASSTPAVCTVTGNVLALAGAGTCTLTASQAGDANHSPAAPVLHSVPVAVNLLSQTITFNPLANQTLGTPAPALVAQASSGLPVSLASITPQLCTVTGSSVSLLGAGTCTLAASQAGNAGYSAATTVLNSFTILAMPQVISFAAPGDQTLGAAPNLLVATSNSGLAVVLVSSTPAVCTVSGSSLTLLAVGTCTVGASQPGNASYLAAVPVSRSFAVAAAPLAAQTISFATPPDQTLGSAPAALVATSTSNLAVTLASTTPGVCTVSGSTLTLVAVGSCSISATQAGNTAFAAASPVSRTFNVAAAPLLAQTISFAAPANQTLGTAAPALVATSSAGLVVSFAATTPTVCTVSGSTLTQVAAGTCSITATQAGNASTAAATAVTRSFSVSVAPLLAQTINFTSPGNQTLGSAPGPLVATATSGLTVVFASSTGTVCSVSGSTLALLAAGTCTVDASQAGNSTYGAATSVSRTFSVAAAPQTITFNTPANQSFGAAPSSLVASASSGLSVAFASTTPTVCSVSGSTVTLLAAGTCSINATQGGNANTAAATAVLRSFVVAPATQTISFATPANQTLGSPPAPLVATSSAGLTVVFASTTPAVCSASGTTLTLVAAGTCSISATQAGNANTAAATAVVRSFGVATAAQTISFTSPGNQTLGTAPGPLVASASSGLVVSITSNTPAVCNASGTTLTLVAVGTCTLTANQAGNATYAPATSVVQSVTVAAAPVELFANGGFETPGASTPANAWLAAASGYSLSSDAHSGQFSAQLSSVAFNAAVMLQNSKDQGLRPDLTVGTSPTLTFWAKGTAGGTGNVLFALRYLDGNGNIKLNSGNRFFQALINPTTWTKITYTLGVVPVGATAAFIEFSQAIGPIDGSNPAGVVLIDDLSLQVGP